MNSTKSMVKQCVTALFIVVNIIGAFIAFAWHLPVYLDSIGTIMIAALYGPVYGLLTGLISSIINGLTFDIFALYFSPAQVITGLIAGLLYKTQWFRKGKKFLGIWIISLPISMICALVSAYVFGGITSAGSSIIVQIMSKAGVNLTLSCFIVQIITDYIDELIGVVIVSIVMRTMTADMKAKIGGCYHG